MGSEKWGSGPGQGTCRTAGKDRKVRLILFDNITMGMAYTAAVQRKRKDFWVKKISLTLYVRYR